MMQTLTTTLRKGQISMSEVSTIRLYLLRAMYLLIAVGLGFTIWPAIISPPDTVANAKTVICALLGALAVLAAVGIRYPLQMLPILLFELLWKVIWVVEFPCGMWRTPGFVAFGPRPFSPASWESYSCPSSFPGLTCLSTM